MDQLTAQDPNRIGPYRLIARLGAGGMGLVYLGRSEGGRTVAVKVVQAEYAGNPEFRKRFAREVAAARRVGGSWTAAVLDADPEAAVPWVATRYIPGPDLHTVVAEDFGPLPEHSVRVLANRLALALQAVHEAGLIHRDLKPSNVLVTVDGPRVIDFGIARAMDSLAGDSMHTRTGTLIGSAGFMSPEQVRGLELTPASDVFCLGAVLVYAATGRLLFGAADTGLNAHLFRVAEEEADLTGVPEPLADLVRDCLHKEPAKRPTLRQVAERTVTDQAEEWLPGTVLAQLGRHAARLLDFAPEAPAEPPAARPESVPEPGPRSQPPPPPAYAPTAPGHFGPAQGFGPPPGPPPGGWSAPPPPASFEDAAPPHPRRWWGLAVIALAQLLVLLEATAFTTALPSVQAELNLPAAELSPMLRAYVFAFGGLVLLGGHIADLVGRRLILIIGLAGFAAASALGGSAGDASMLGWARALQGVSAALLTPSALALVATGFTDPKERGRAFGIYAAVVAGGSALGLLTSGWLLEHLTWRWSLYAAVPVALLALIGTLTLVHDRPTRTGARPDVPGVLFGTAGTVAVTYGLAEGGTLGWADPLVLLLLVAGTALLGAFLWWQNRASGPSPTPPTARGRDRIGCFLALLLASFGITSSFPALTFYLESVLRYAPATTGVAFLAVVAAIAIGSTQVSARLQPRIAPRVLIVAGLVVTAVGLVLLTGLDLEGTYVTHALPGMLLAGLGIGVAFMPLFATATAGIAPQRSGTAAAALSMAQHLGATIGVLVLGNIIAAGFRNSSWPAPIVGDMLRSYTTGLWWAVGALLLAALVAGLTVTAKAPGRDGKPVHTAR
uniref:MDR family MFS transporter n=1 Tax=Streptomyces sp. NBC_00049 TaxID=2903617 RepID=A0AAU2JXL9_9ACTN